MSYADAPSPMKQLLLSGAAHWQRIAAIGLIVIAAAALAAALQPSLRPAPLKIVQDTQGGPYPLRVALPQSVELPTEELAQLIEEHEAESGQVTQGRSLDTGFADAFGTGTFGERAEQPKLAMPVDLEPGGFLDLDYDIGTLEPVAEKLDRSDGSLTVDKPLLVDGVNAGSATIRIEEGANILISVNSVAKALGPKAETLPKRISGALAKGSGFIPFHELRGAGILVEYDPVRDRVAMSMPS